MMSDSEVADTASYNRDVLRRFLRNVWPYKRALVGSVFAVLGFSLSTLAIPLTIGLTIDRALGADGRTGLLTAMVALLVGLAVINWISNYLQQIVIGGASQRVLYDLRGQMFGHLQRVGLSFTDRIEIGRVMARLQGDVGALQEFLEVGIQSLGDIVTLLGIAIVLLVLDWRLGMLTLVVVGLATGCYTAWRNIREER